MARYPKARLLPLIIQPSVSRSLRVLQTTPSTLLSSSPRHTRLLSLLLRQRHPSTFSILSLPSPPLSTIKNTRRTYPTPSVPPQCSISTPSSHLQTDSRPSKESCFSLFTPSCVPPSRASGTSSAGHSVSLLISDSTLKLPSSTLYPFTIHSLLISADDSFGAPTQSTGRSVSI